MKLLTALIKSSFTLYAIVGAQTDTSLELPSIHNTSSSTACADLHLIVVRASNEPPGQGIIGTLATRISAANPGSSVEAIDYPAVLNPYNISSANGTAETTKQLISYVDSCDRAKIVLLGYSQGAHVIGDVMCGGGGLGLGPKTPPVDSKYSDKVVAMIQMGDPRHMPNKTYNVGTSNHVGLFPRTADISCDQFSSKIQSYCDVGDPVCDRGDNVTVHRLYTFKYNDDAFDFVMGKLENSSAGTPMQNTSASTTSPNPAVTSNTSVNMALSLLDIHGDSLFLILMMSFVVTVFKSI